MESIEYQEKKSKFIGYIFDTSCIKDANDIISNIKSEHKKADHILYCYRVKNEYGIYQVSSSNDKEPITSMTKLREIFERKDLQNKLIVIVRYFGGVKLGASNLDKIYFDIGIKLIS